MAQIEINDGFILNANRPLDLRGYKQSGEDYIAWSSISEANAGIVAGVRFRGMLVPIDNGVDGLIMYMYKDGTLNGDLIIWTPGSPAPSSPTSYGLKNLQNGDAQGAIVSSVYTYTWQKNQYRTYMLFNIEGAIPKHFKVPLPDSATLTPLPNDTYIDLAYVGGEWYFDHDPGVDSNDKRIVLLNGTLAKSFKFTIPGWHQFVKYGNLWYQTAAPYLKSATNTPYLDATGNFTIGVSKDQVVDSILIKSTTGNAMTCRLGTTPGGTEITDYFPVDATNPQPINLGYLVNADGTIYVSNVVGTIKYKVLYK